MITSQGQCPQNENSIFVKDFWNELIFYAMREECEQMDTAEEAVPPLTPDTKSAVTSDFPASMTVMNKDTLFISCPAAQQNQSMTAPHLCWLLKVPRP